MKKGLFVLLALLASVFLVSYVSADNTYTNSSFMTLQGNNPVNSQFLVSVLKYEPYPVSPGESFDLWVKVENVGQNDASNAKFVLNLSYPFSSNESLEQDYGLIYGLVNANAVRKVGEVTSQANQVILKYRITVDPNASPGLNYVKLTSYTDSLDYGVTVNLPIVVDKTKTDFNIDLQKASSDGYTFLISNVGQNDANSLSVSLQPEDGLTFLGDRIFVVGNLNTGDFTKFTAPFSLKGTQNLTFNIDYTDSSGARREIQKTVSIEGINSSDSNSVGVNNPVTKWIYAFVGFLLGIVAMIVVKKKQIRNLNKK